MKSQKNNPRKTDRKNPVPPAEKISEEEFVSRVQTLVSPMLETEGIELVLAEFRREPGGQILRLFLDRPGGVAIEDLALASRRVSDLLDVYFGEGPPYRLEVSSPGANRPLVREEHFIRFAGHRAVIRLKEPLNGRKTFTGLLDKVENGAVTIVCDNVPWTLPLSAVATARLRP